MAREPILKRTSREVYVPRRDGDAEEPITPNRGLALDRRKATLLSKARINASSGDWCITAQNMCEIQENSNLKYVNEKLMQVSGLVVQQVSSDDAANHQKSKNPKSSPLNNTTPRVTLDISNGAVHSRTGFFSVFSMLAFILMVCNGDVDLVMKKDPLLTWLEEWVLYLQWMWGR